MLSHSRASSARSSANGPTTVVVSRINSQIASDGGALSSSAGRQSTSGDATPRRRTISKDGTSATSKPWSPSSGSPEGEKPMMGMSILAAMERSSGEEVICAFPCCQ